MAQLSLTNYGMPTKNIKTISNFGGLDKSNSVLNVSDNRASEMLNFEKRNGINQKRYGFTYTTKLTDKINGFWNYINEDNENVVVIKSGSNFYLIRNFGLPNENKELLSQYNGATSLNQESFGIVKDKKLYVLTGSSYCVIKRMATTGTNRYKLVALFNDTETYIPTTSIGGVAIGAVGERTSLESKNMLSSSWINTFRGEQTGTEITTFSYYLDMTNEEYDLCIDEETGDLLPGTIRPYALTSYNTYAPIVGATYEKDTATGYVKMTLQQNIIPLVDGEDNIKVVITMPTNYEHDIIYSCQFGILYGIENNKDRLFISGSNIRKNVDYRSGDSNGTSDLTYFPLDNYTTFGSNATGISGYSLLSNGSMAVLKEKSQNEPSIYYRNAILNAVIDENGQYLTDITGKQLYMENYPITIGNIGESPLSYKTIQNLSGDSLFIGENGIFSIALETNTANNTIRYAKPRGRFIDYDLLQQSNLENISTTIHDGKYFVAVNDIIYLADSRYKIQMQDDTDTFQYDWWKWELSNLEENISLLFEYNNELYIGSENGTIFKYDKTTFQDINITSNYASIISSGENATIFTYSDSFIEELKHMSWDRIELTSNDYPIYSLVINNIDERIFKVEQIDGRNQSVYQLSFIEINNLYDKQIVHTIDDNGEYDGIPFMVHFLGENKVYFTGDDGTTRVDFVDAPNCKVCIDIENVVVNEIINNEVSFKMNGIPLTLISTISYETLSSNLSTRLKKIRNVSSLYITKAFDFNSTIYSKNIERISITPDAQLCSSLEFAYKTRYKEKDFKVGGVGLFDLYNLDFENFTFETTTFPRSYNKKLNERNFNYIQFIIKSNTNGNCVVNKIDIVYRYSKLNKGVR